MDTSYGRAEPAATEKLEQCAVGQLKPYANNARTHSPRQIKQIARSIERFGFVNPVLADATGQIIAGHGRVEAAKQLGLTSVPVLRIEHLSPAEIRAYTLADNRLAEKAGWDQEMLAIELQGLIDLDFEVELTGFEMGEIDIILDATPASQAVDDVAEQVPAYDSRSSVTQPGDLWVLGQHWLVCADALQEESLSCPDGGREGAVRNHRSSLQRAHREQRVWVGQGPP